MKINNKTIITIISYIVTGGFLYYVAVKKIDSGMFMATVSTARYEYVLMALGVSLFFRLLYHPWLWQKLLASAEVNVSYRDLVTVNASSLPLKFLLPFKITELVRPVVLNVLGNINYSLALGSALLLRLLIVMATISLVGVGALLTANASVLILAVLGIAASMLVIGLIAYMPIQSTSAQITSFRHTFKHIPVNTKYALFLRAVLMQTGEIVSAYCIVQALGATLGLPQIIAGVSIMMLAGMEPLSVQGIGVRETVAISLFSGVISNEMGLAFGLMITIIHHIIPAICGGLVWVFDSTARIISYGNLTECHR